LSNRRLNDIIKFQKALALAAGASNPHEAKAAELAVRRLVKGLNLDPTRLPDFSYVAHINFANNPLLQKLRDEYRAAHPHEFKIANDGTVRRVKAKRTSTKPFNTKPKPAAKPKRTAEPEPEFNTSTLQGAFEDFMRNVNAAAAKPKPAAKTKSKPVFNTKTKPKPGSDRNRDRHSPGYMRDYMRAYQRRRRAQKAD
jgi:hypothetical protein